MQLIVITLIRMTVAVAMIIMIISTVLCVRKKKNPKKNGTNSAQKVFPPNKKTINEGKKDVEKNKLNDKENVLASNQLTDTIDNKKNEKKKEKVDSDDNVPPVQDENLVYEMDRCSDGFPQFPDPDDKETFYPPVPEPTASAKRKREEELERDREEKIKEGFYQSRSDEDDTLEPIKSLKDEETDPADKSSGSKKIKSLKNASQRDAQKLKTHPSSAKKNEKQKPKN
ncbi:unnamed protein product [Litomosoides sigmodontis]|uniref:Uncharacterized protein n=1 Tax=Litomosoides sigmodontis TaxID=42156 RepID=A0A3P6U2I0_LITSI|nr:unnamed protein product [Litomosoides sigmodontis]